MKVCLAWIFLLLTLTTSLIVNVFGKLTSDLNNVMGPPSLIHWLGTDSIGRDIFLRVLQGFGTSMVVGILALAIALLVGVAIGGLAGWLGSWSDLFLMRFTDFIDGVPDLLLALAFILSLQVLWPDPSVIESIVLMSFSLGMVAWTRFARQTRALVLQEKTKGYALSARVSGAGTTRIIFRHLWPNIRTPILRFSIIHFPGLVLFEGSLSFFGLGIKPPATSLGLLLQEGWRTISIAPHLVGAPAIFIFLTLVSFEVLSRKFDLWRGKTID